MYTLQFVPFFYFQQTRLNNLRAFVFHSAYEWLPALLVVILSLGLDWHSIVFLGLYYLGFISFYEIGYMANDQLAYHYNNERKRSAKFSLIQLIAFISIRLVTFGAVVVITEKESNYQWWLWYAVLFGTFATHNLLKSALLKSITFLVLAFIRFFSPFVFLIDKNLFQILALPIVLNYVLYRMFTYMDSKNLFVNIDRKSDSFRIGYYLLMMWVSVLLSAITSSFLPLVVNAYFLAVNSITFLPKPHRN